MSKADRVGIAPATAAAAADWFARLQEEDAGEGEFKEWREWLEAAPEHSLAYRQIERAWRLIGDVRPAPWASSEELRDDPTLAALGTVRAQRIKWTASLTALAAAVVLTFGVFLTLRFIDLFSPGVYATRIAEQRSVRLPDGSRVTLGGETRIRTAFDGVNRRVLLEQGEAYFDVAHDGRRPFVVHAGVSEIRAVGTAFDVRTALDGVAVRVTEGRVAIALQATSGPPAMLAAGDEVMIASSGMVRKRPPAATIAPTWLQGRFEYRGEELRRVIEDLNRYTDRHIVLADDTLGALRYSGTVFPDHLDEWLEGIGGVLPVAVREKGQQRELFRTP